VIDIPKNEFHQEMWPCSVTWYTQKPYPLEFPVSRSLTRSKPRNGLNQVNKKTFELTMHPAKAASKQIQYKEESDHV
jgi:hypothetical protein